MTVTVRPVAGNVLVRIPGTEVVSSNVSWSSKTTTLTFTPAQLEALRAALNEARDA